MVKPGRLGVNPKAATTATAAPKKISPNKDSFMIETEDADSNLLREPSTTLQRVLKLVYGRTKNVSETSSLAQFLFKDTPPEE